MPTQNSRLKFWNWIVGKRTSGNSFGKDFGGMQYNKCSKEPILISDGRTDGRTEVMRLERSLSTSVQGEKIVLLRYFVGCLILPCKHKSQKSNMHAHYCQSVCWSLQINKKKSSGYPDISCWIYGNPTRGMALHGSSYKMCWNYQKPNTKGQAVIFTS